MPWISINEWKRKNGIGKLEPRKKAKEPKPEKEKRVFKLMGYDTFSDEWYRLGEYLSEKEARAAGVKKLEELVITQPASSSGGQGIFGIQDRVYIDSPDGNRHRVLG